MAPKRRHLSPAGIHCKRETRAASKASAPFDRWRLQRYMPNAFRGRTRTRRCGRSSSRTTCGPNPRREDPRGGVGSGVPTAQHLPSDSSHVVPRTVWRYYSFRRFSHHGLFPISSVHVDCLEGPQPATRRPAHVEPRGVHGHTCEVLASVGDIPATDLATNLPSNRISRSWCLW